MKTKQLKKCQFCAKTIFSITHIPGRNGIYMATAKDLTRCRMSVARCPMMKGRGRTQAKHKVSKVDTHSVHLEEPSAFLPVDSG